MNLKFFFFLIKKSWLNFWTVTVTSYMIGSVVLCTETRLQQNSYANNIQLVEFEHQSQEEEQ